MREHRTARWSSPAIVALAIIATISVYVLAAYLSRFFPSEQEMCTATCAKENQVGYLEYLHSAQQTAGMRDKGSTQCKCR
ncbi:hypothetical protein SAMN05428968_1184 [Janthinobacterium sp. YR213]|nr:hypothetical protein SAMN05428968_1184 [Janthinobacterium sp. YR213]